MTKEDVSVSKDGEQSLPLLRPIGLSLASCNNTVLLCLRAKDRGRSNGSHTIQRAGSILIVRVILEPGRVFSLIQVFILIDSGFSDR